MRGESRQPRPSRREQVAAWSLVAGQVGLLAALVLPAPGSARAVPRELGRLGAGLSAAGMTRAVAAAAALGPALTPSPLPNGGQLRTDGPYARVRHPLYGGLLVFAAGQVLRSPSPVRAACAAGLLALLTAKARWEEARLVARFPGYRAYAAQVPRFLPRILPGPLGVAHRLSGSAR